VTCLKPEKDPEVRLKMFTILSTNVIGREELLKDAPYSGPFLIKLVKGMCSCSETFISCGIEIPHKEKSKSESIINETLLKKSVIL
jgi:hypothetical protein